MEQRDVRGAQQRIGIERVIRINGCADAGARGQLPAIDGQRLLQGINDLRGLLADMIGA